jgi:cell division transport system ATP-binding protein
MLIREERPSAGKIYVGEEEVSALRRSKIYRLRRNIGVVFQDFKLIDDKNIYENVAFALEASGKSDEEIKEIVPYVLDIVGLSYKMYSFPKELSGGQKQKAAIARAISNDPDILIADEPTGNLDEKSTWDIVGILQKINEWGTTVIMCTHDKEVLDKVQARLLLLESGNLVSDSMNKFSKKKKQDFEKTLSKTEKSEKPSPKSKSEKVEKMEVAAEKPVKKENNLEINDFEKALDEGYHEKAATRTKPKLKFGLKNKKKIQAEPDLDFKSYGISKSTEKLLKKNNYKNMQDLINQSIEKIELIEGITNDQLVEIEKAITKFSS